jgi:hypothetical protein
MINKHEFRIRKVWPADNARSTKSMSDVRSRGDAYWPIVKGGANAR